MSPNAQDTIITTLRDFPSVEILASSPRLSEYVESLSRVAVTAVVKETIAAAKEAFGKNKKPLSEAALLDAVVRGLKRLESLKLTPVINGAGIVIHTNLGRAPIARSVLEGAIEAGSGYSNLEFDLTTGKRGKRGLYIEHLLAMLCETESGTIVNNNAAALFIILNSLANRKEVIISRGELVQIGGGFKIPEIMAKAGAKLVEVGTTNRTGIQDYTAAITERTRMILKVHRSNFAQVGFVEETSIGELSGLCREKDLILVNDLGSGLIAFPPEIKITNEPNVSESVRSGADITCFSGDKLLGGTQAGLIAGRADLIARLKKNPLFRTLRCDKLVFAITAQVLTSYVNGTQFDDIPVWKMITIPVTDLKLRGEDIISACPGKNIVMRATQAYLGGGTTPAQTIPSLALSMRGTIKANTLARRFRQYATPIIGRVEEDNFFLDLRTIPDQFDSLIIDAINEILE